MSHDDHARLRDLILYHAGDADPRAAIAQTAPRLLETLFAQPHVRNAPGVLNAQDRERAELALEQDIFVLVAERGRLREIAEAVEDITGLVDEGLTWRISQANAARFAAQRGPQIGAGEAVIAPNGVAMDKEEREGLLRLTESIDFTRNRHPR
ncbi:MAG: DNA primase, partial [Rhodobacteraceae bacterium]|nr:DNA primase [Paracoccaceae bacterium]